MKPEVNNAFIAANAATAAVQVAVAAAELLKAEPDAWALADQAYWLCRAAQDTAQCVADSLVPVEAEHDDASVYAFRVANEAIERACEAADELVSLAETAGHTIRR